MDYNVHFLPRSERAGNKSQVRDMIHQGNLEVLEELVLHGHGDKLLGETSSDPVVQEFLDTVPGYMVICLNFLLLKCAR